MLSLKESEKYLQQSTLVLSSVENKVLMQEVAKVKERTKQLGKIRHRFKKWSLLVSKRHITMAKILGQNSTQVEGKSD